jgi:HlyD family secretion protein
MTSNQRPEATRVIRRLNLAGVAAAVLTLGAATAWATTAQMAGAVIAAGTVVVESYVKKVQHLSGGIVAEIFVKEGSRVDADQLLLRLDDTLLRANLGVVQSQLDLLVAREARLSAERDEADNVVFPPTLVARSKERDIAVSIGGEQKLFEARSDARRGQRSQFRERILQTEQEVAGLTAQQTAKNSEIKFIGEELAGVADLYKQNLVTIVRYMQLQRDQARLRGEHGQLTAQIARSRAKIAETELQMLQLEQDFRTEVLKDLRETQGRIAELGERVNAAQDQFQRVEIRAPQAGVVYQLTTHTVGGVIAPGETVMQIVPKADRLLIEAKIAPQDVDQLVVGAPVYVRVLAGNRRTLGDLRGTLLLFGPDVMREQQSSHQPFYLARVELAEDPGSGLGGLQLMPGMPVEVYVRTEDRTPLDYLIKPLREQVARTFRER